ncbi:MAG: response regulator [Lachnospiraceae bacterium]|jgi:two-component system chemotaxis response regulator CheY|nr:response regulator [Lachnospiraceae bacterium]
MSSKPTILVCDDSILARKQLSDVVKHFMPNSNIVEAANGQDGVELFEDEKPSLTFLDLVMPVMDGISAIKEMKKINSKANIVVVSSIGTKSELKQAIEAGAMDFIQKPFSVDQIKMLLESYFKED